MSWPVGGGVRLTKIKSDEAEGVLYINASLEDETEICDIVYEGMFYSQLDDGAAGLNIVSVTEITPEELRQPEHAAAAARLYEDCGADDVFLWDMYSRKNNLFVHRADNGGEYIVLAKKRVFHRAPAGVVSRGLRKEVNESAS